MGRITIFTIESCGHCERTKAALTSRNIPFHEISLSSYPSKRSDMLSLSNELSVPQIFFNETHIGGADKTLDLLKRWDEELSDSDDSHTKQTPLERYKEEVESKPDPTDSRLQAPTEPPIPLASPPPRRSNQMDDEFELPSSNDSSSNKTSSYAKLYQTLLQILPRESKPYRGKSYKNCFTGKEAVDAVLYHYHLEHRNDAVAFLITLQQDKMLDHVTHDHPIDDNMKFYRLQSFFQPHLLNTIRVWSDRVDPNANALVIRLKSMLNQVISNATDPSSDCKVDYIKAKQDPLFWVFQEASCELQKINMGELTATATLAFGINLYNLMILHAFVQLGIPDTMYQRVNFFNKIGYNIGGQNFTFNQLEHGILRSNKKIPYTLFAPFSLNDSRLSMILEKLDPRIHFALNCGAKSCPPIKTFTTESLEEELRIVTQSFNECDDNVYVNETNNKITLSMLYNWYLSDFTSSKSQLPDVVLTFLRDGTEKKQKLEQMILESKNKKKIISVNFFDYDWSTNASNQHTFCSQDLDVTTLSMSAMLKLKE